MSNPPRKLTQEDREKIRLDIQTKQLARYEASKPEAVAPPQPDDDWFRDNYPILWEYLCFTYVEGKFKKKPPTLVIKVETGSVVVTLSDYGMNQTLSVPAGTLLDGLRWLERNVGSADAPWQTWQKKGEALQKLDVKKDDKGKGGEKS